MPEEGALKYIAGYSIGLDMTIRGPEERSLRKSLDRFLRRRSLFRYGRRDRRSRQPRDGNHRQRHCGKQKANTSQLIFGVAKLDVLLLEFNTGSIRATSS